MITYSLLMCVLNNIAVRKSLHYKQEWLRTFVVPGLASLIMGVLAYLIYQGIYMLLKINVVALCVAILVAVFVYFALEIWAGGLTKDEILNMPKGATLVRILQKIKLL